MTNYNTREASQHSLLRQFRVKAKFTIFFLQILFFKKSGHPRMRSKIGCFYFADLSNEDSPFDSPHGESRVTNCSYFPKLSTKLVNFAKFHKIL